MMDENKLSIEELTAKLTEANERIQAQENEIISLNAKLDSVNTKLFDESEHVKQLQKANLDLYMRVPVNQEQTANKVKGVDPASRKAQRDAVDWTSIINKL